MTAGRPDNDLPSGEQDLLECWNLLSMYADRTSAAGQPIYESILAFSYWKGKLLLKREF